MCSFSTSLGLQRVAKPHTGDALARRLQLPSRGLVKPVTVCILVIFAQPWSLSSRRDGRNVGLRKLFPAEMRWWVVRVRDQCLSYESRAHQSRSLQGYLKIQALDAGCPVVASRSRRVERFSGSPWSSYTTLTQPR